MRKRRQDLTEAQTQVLNRLLEHSPDLQAAYALREGLTAIFDELISKRAAQTKLRKWIEQVAASGVKCFDDFIKTLNRLWKPITNYFLARKTSAFVEDLNGYRLFLFRPPYVA